MNRIVFSLSVAIAAGVSGYAGYRYAMHRTMDVPPPAAAAAAGDAAKSDGRRVLYWYDPMVPQQRFDKPGKSPYMDMQLVPKYADDTGGGDAAGIAISPAVTQNLGMRTAVATRGSLAAQLEAVGTVGWNERSVVLVQARAAGFVEKLHARTPLDPVSRGAPLVEIFFPEWAGAQEEYLLLRRQAADEVRPLAAAARQRLLLLGMREDDIAIAEQEGRAVARFTLRSPITGVIAELGVREGMTVAAGAALFRIVDLSSVWITAEVPEAQAGGLRPGGAVEVRVPAVPEQVFRGKLSAILPEINTATRTVRARIELANPGARLKPGMFASLSFAGHRGPTYVLAPSEALIRTGARSVVIVADSEGRFRAVDVEPGIESGGQVEIRKGLAGGERVVVSGQFLIDSEANLRAALGRMEAMPASTAAPGSAAHPPVLARGAVTAIDVAGGRIELEHEPIPALKWPAMVMMFPVADKVLLSRVKRGDAVDFALSPKANPDGEHVIEAIRLRGAPGRP